MGYLIAFAVGLVVGFAGGWAVYKHRAGIKQSVKEKL